MQFKTDFLKNYLNDAPLALAIERSMECEILSKKKFIRPVLDIGCGDGIFVKNLFSEKVDVGIDPNPKELSAAGKLDVYNELIQCFGDNIPKMKETFKTIFSNSVLEHIPEIKRVLLEANRLLAREGTLYVTLPTDLFDKYTIIYQILSKLKMKKLAAFYIRFFNKFWRHYHCYSHSHWRELFEECGFQINDVFGYGPKSICMLNTFLTPFALLSFFSKKLTNQWFVLPIRKLLSPFFFRIFSNVIKYKNITSDKNGLIFFELIKK